MSSSEIVFLDEKVNIGAHIGKLSTLYQSVEYVLQFPINCAQIYLSSGRSYAPPKVDKKDMKLTRELVEKFNFRVYVHSCLLYNLNGGTYIDTIDTHLEKAKTEKQKSELQKKKHAIPYNFQKTKDGLIAELDICAEAFGTGVVVHIGSGDNRDKAIKRIASTVDYVLEGNKKRYILLENAAGEGNKIGSTLQDLIDIYVLIKTKDQVGFCIDTCHLYAAGEYDIEIRKNFKKFFKRFDNNIGLKKLRLVHLNDSKGEFGCKKDRHENIGQGYIFQSEKGVKSLKYLVNFCNKNEIDMVLETPGRHDINVAKIWSLC